MRFIAQAGKKILLCRQKPPPSSASAFKNSVTMQGRFYWRFAEYGLIVFSS